MRIKAELRRSAGIWGRPPSLSLPPPPLSLSPSSPFLPHAGGQGLCDRGADGDMRRLPWAIDLRVDHDLAMVVRCPCRQPPGGSGPAGIGEPRAHSGRAGGMPSRFVSQCNQQLSAIQQLDAGMRMKHAAAARGMVCLARPKQDASCLSVPCESRVGAAGKYRMPRVLQHVHKSWSRPVFHPLDLHLRRRVSAVRTGQLADWWL